MAWDSDKVPGQTIESDDYDERTTRIKSSLGAADSITFADGDVTPSVANATLCKTANTALTTITNFDDATEKVIVLQIGDAFTSIANNANIKLMGGNLYTGVLYDTLTLVYNGSLWLEVSRGTNS